MKALLVVLLLGLASSATAAPTNKNVIIGTYLNNIPSVDIKNSQFTVDFYVWFRWEGDDWKPLETFELANGRITSKTGFVKKKLGTQNYALCRVLATMTKFWDMRRFPLDNHTLTLEIEDAELDDRSLAWDVDADNTGHSPELEIPGWIIKHTQSKAAPHHYRTNYGDTSLPSNQQSSYSRYVYALDVARPGYGRFLRVFFGLFVAVLISWCAFFVRPKESSPRVSLGIGATFAAAAVTVAINNSLPDTNSVTMADKLVMLTLGMIVASVFVTITALWLFAVEKDATRKRMDRLCSILFPVAYSVLLLLILR